MSFPRTLLFQALVILLGVLFGLLPAAAQSPAFGSATLCGTAAAGGASYANASAADGGGNLYVAGYFDGTVAFGTTTLTSAGSLDVFVAKRSPAGAWLWAVQAGGTDGEVATGLALDGAGNPYLTGRFRSTAAAFGTATLATAGQDDVWAAKLDAQGAWLWAVRAGGTGTDTGQGIAVDGGGNAYLTGYTNQPSATFGATTLANTTANAFLAKLGPAGAWLWAVASRGTSFPAFGNGVAVDAAGNAYVAGSFQFNTSFGTSALAAAGLNDAFVAKASPSGVWLWARAAGGTGVDGANGLAVDAAGDGYITGFTNGAAAFGPFAPPAVDGPAFVAKFGPAGTWLWAARGGGAVSAAGTAVAGDGSGGVWVTGSFGPGTATFGAAALASNGNGDLFVARLTPAGQWGGAVGGGGAGADAGQSLAVDGGHVWACGGAHGPFNGPLSTTLAFGPLAVPANASGTSGFAVRVAGTALASARAGLGAAQPLAFAPNPARARVWAAGLAPGARVEAVDAAGRTVGNLPVAADGGLSIEALPPGLYLLRYTDGAGRRYAGRLVIE